MYETYYSSLKIIKTFTICPLSKFHYIMCTATVQYLSILAILTQNLL